VSTDDSPTDLDLKIARLVDRGMPFEQAQRVAPHLTDAPYSASAGVAAPPDQLAFAAGDPGNAAALAAAATGGEVDSEAQRFLAMSAEELASLPADEYKAGMAAVKAAGLL
jgi:hypothetical protein